MPLIKCPECGKEISDQAVKCPNCGFPVQKESSAPPAPGTWERYRTGPAKPAGKGVFYICLICVILFFLIAAVSVFAFFRLHNNNQKNGSGIPDESESITSEEASQIPEETQAQSLQQETETVSESAPEETLVIIKVPFNLYTIRPLEEDEALFEKYNSSVTLENGYTIITLLPSTRDALAEDYLNRFENTLNEYLEDPDYSFKKIYCSDTVDRIDFYFNGNILPEKDGNTVLDLLFQGLQYQLVAGVPPEEANVTITLFDSSGKAMYSTSWTELMNAALEQIEKEQQGSSTAQE